MIDLYNGDCLEVMKNLESNSVDSIVSDPPYGISFMGKKWDYDVPSVEIWTEALRVLKHGGHALIACGTRTQHRMAVNLEDAGFEIRDIVAWVYGSGFPKSHNIGKSVNALETKEWSKIGNAIDNIDNKSIIEVWKTNLNNVNNVETQSQKNQTEAGIVIPKSVFVQENVITNTSQKNLNLSVGFVVKNLKEAQATNTKINIALQNVKVEIKQSLNLAKSVEKLSQDQNLKSWNIFIAQENVKEWLKENTMVNHKVDEVLKTLRGNQKYSKEEIINVLFVVIQNILKLTILNQSKTFQNLDTTSQMECVSAINVTITEYTMEHLITNTVDILKSKAVDKLQGNERDRIEKIYPDGSKPRKTSKYVLAGEDLSKTSGSNNIETKGNSPYEGWGTALKPAMELWTLCRKPLEEKTVAQNVLKHGTGGINIDGCRVSLKGEKAPKGSGNGSVNASSFNPGRVDGNGGNETSSLGRFPANFIHNGSDEVVKLFPDVKIGSISPYIQTHNPEDTVASFSKGMGAGTLRDFTQDSSSGNASRFFYCAKASKSERNEGLEGFEEKLKAGTEFRPSYLEKFNENGDSGSPRARFGKMKNNHPTVKPIELMKYLCRLITPKDGIVLDPFMGSGSTGIGAKLENFKFTGIELDPEYFKIAEKRISNTEQQIRLTDLIGE